MDSILPASFIIFWYKFTTASILSNDSGEIRKGEVSQGWPCPPIPPLTHREDTDQTRQHPMPHCIKDVTVRGRNCWGLRVRGGGLSGASASHTSCLPGKG